jgi:hypothetical protein
LRTRRTTGIIIALIIITPTIRITHKLPGGDWRLRRSPRR